MSKPTIDLADAFPNSLSIDIKTTGLLNLSLILDATIPKTPSCQSFPLKTITGSNDVLSIFLRFYLRHLFLKIVSLY